MPCFNHAQFVVESVNGILGQTHRDLELMIVDDGSIDNSWEIIRNLMAGDSRIRGIRHVRNQGASKSRNDGLRAASGEFIGFCDADDIWEPQKLERQLDLLQTNPTYDVVYCDTIFVDENGSPTGQRFSEYCQPPKPPSGGLFGELVKRNFVNIQGVLMRKKCIQQVGHFDEQVKWVEDWWYWVQLSRHHRFLYSPEILGNYRVHSHSTGFVQKRGYRVNRLKVFKRILRKYSDLSPAIKADILYKIGVDLYELGKLRIARRLFWKSVRLSMTDARAFSSLCRAMRRIIMFTGMRHYPAVVKQESQSAG